ncbi:zf-TFIIB domain-containing protein [Yersinia rochesterensis]|uniref:TFIIB-type zinc ribbon-containing protein n=1 Tax=Yersinia TaxID=629 RepID=UPI002240775B|nr:MULTISPECIES: zf-TFIIB domain-containing protein [Yersinia]MDA5542963.1 zf-TFIIB domain-containing protein [Yersinia rochesterensis]UZM76805.1 zf-TFIIB domain-containing protein [Yersinia sp. SCPM-O-B-9106 (C-191)]
MQCPVCKDTQLVMSERKSIEIDYCPNCRGVWLDRGELDKIIEKSTESAPAASYAEPRNSDRDREHHGYSKPKHYKKKSFLSELFD